MNVATATGQLTLRDLKKLKVGDAMVYTTDGMTGEVCETGCGGVRIQWDDGQKSTLFFNSENPRQEYIRRAS